MNVPSTKDKGSRSKRYGFSSWTPVAPSLFGGKEGEFLDKPLYSWGRENAKSCEGKKPREKMFSHSFWVAISGAHIKQGPQHSIYSRGLLLPSQCMSISSTPARSSRIAWRCKSEKKGKEQNIVNCGRVVNKRFLPSYSVSSKSSRLCPQDLPSWVHR